MASPARGGEFEERAGYDSDGSDGSAESTAGTAGGGESQSLVDEGEQEEGLPVGTGAPPTEEEKREQRRRTLIRIVARSAVHTAKQVVQQEAKEHPHRTRDECEDMALAAQYDGSSEDERKCRVSYATSPPSNDEDTAAAASQLAALLDTLLPTQQHKDKVFPRRLGIDAKTCDLPPPWDGDHGFADTKLSRTIYQFVPHAVLFSLQQLSRRAKVFTTAMGNDEARFESEASWWKAHILFDVGLAALRLAVGCQQLGVLPLEAVRWDCVGLLCLQLAKASSVVRTDATITKTPGWPVACGQLLAMAWMKAALGNPMPKEQVKKVLWYTIYSTLTHCGGQQGPMVVVSKAIFGNKGDKALAGRRVVKEVMRRMAMADTHLLRRLGVSWSWDVDAVVPQSLPGVVLPKGCTAYKAMGKRLHLCEGCVGRVASRALCRLKNNCMARSTAGDGGVATSKAAACGKK